MINYSSPKDFIKTGSPRDLPLDNPHPKDRDSSPLIELTHQTGHSAADSVEVSTPPQGIFTFSIKLILLLFFVGP